MVVIGRWLLYKNTADNDYLTKWLLCTGFLKKSACQIWCEDYLGQNKPSKVHSSCKQLNKVSRTEKALHEVCKTFKTLSKV